MKTIKDYTSFVNENVKVQETVDVELDQDVIDYYLEIAESGALSKEEVIDQVANDFGISGEAVAIIVDAAGIKESVEVEEEDEEEVIEESVEEEIEDETEEEVIEESVEEEIEDETEEEVVEESVEEETEEETDEEINEASDEDEYLTPKQKKLPEALKKGIIAKNKKAGKKAGDKKEDKDDDKDDKKDDKKEDKEDKKDDSGKSDEDKYLSAKQKKLPEGLKKAIIKKAKAKK